MRTQKVRTQEVRTRKGSVASPATAKLSPAAIITTHLARSLCHRSPPGNRPYAGVEITPSERISWVAVTVRRTDWAKCPARPRGVRVAFRTDRSGFDPN